MIGKSTEFRKRFTIILNGHKETRFSFKDKIEILQKSERKYEKLYLSNIELNTSWQWIGARKWKSISFSKCIFDLKAFHEFMALQRSSIKELRINDVSVDGNQTGFNNDLALQFTALEKLFLGGTQLSVLPLLLQSHGCLQNVKITTMSDCHRSCIEELLLIIKLNPTISEISLRGYDSIKFFESDAILELPLKLKILEIEIRSCSVNATKNVQQFIEQQVSTLKMLFIQNLPDFGLIFKMWNSLQKMRSLQIKNFESVKAFHVPNLRPNRNLLSLNIDNSKFGKLQNRWDRLLKLSPNVEHILFECLTEEIVRFVAVNCMKLKTLRYQKTEVGIEALYEQMKMDGNGVNKNIIIKREYDWDVVKGFM